MKFYVYFIWLVFFARAIWASLQIMRALLIGIKSSYNILIWFFLIFAVGYVWFRTLRTAFFIGLMAAVIFLTFRYFRVYKNMRTLRFSTLSGVEFEEYLSHLFVLKGYDVYKTPTSGDFGADLIVEKQGVYTAIQIKRYERPVGIEAVQEITAARNYYSCDQGMVVTNNRYTRQAIALAEVNHIVLWDGARLNREILINGL